MRLLKKAALALVLVMAASGCKEEPRQSAPLVTNAQSQYPTKAQPKLPTTKLYLGPRELTAEVAMTDGTREAGLMHRTTMGENEGMLFVFPIPHKTAFWMKNTVLPLSIAYIDPDGVIKEIHDLEPGNTNSVGSAAGNVQFALEVNRGWFTRNKVEPGTLVQTERGPLKQSFSGLR
jgi:uncharacterized protein